MKISRRKSRRNRGSALLVSLMVIVGLSLLGLGFVAISETETAIAKNEQNALQTQAIAEAGAKLVVEWFQDPTWGETTGGQPTNATCATFGTSPCSADGSPGQYMKTVRTIGGYKGVYKSQASTKLFDTPYKGQNYDRLFGDENNADIIINRTTNAAAIDSFNSILLGSDLTAGEVSEIRVYAPPIVNGTLTNGFWVGGERYGVATIKVTAQQYRLRSGTGATAVRSGIIASHAVRIVVGQVPIPIPGGPIQSNTAISFGGDFVVHWGNETSTGNLTNKRNPTSVPWANAYERPHFEHGFEPGSSIVKINITNPGSGYIAGPSVTIAAPPAGGTQATVTGGVATITGGKVTGISLSNQGLGYVNTPPPPTSTGSSSWGPVVTIGAPPAGGTQATAVAYIGSEIWPITGGQFEDADYLHELISKQYEDPWFGSRAKGDNSADGVGPPSPTNAQCYPYAFTNAEDSNSNASYFFQWQSVNLYPWQKVVTFPSIVYDFWKKITSQSRGYKGLYYFKNDGTSNYLLSGTGTANTMCSWVNIQTNGMGAGIYFFDSLNNTNPQGLTGAAKTAALSAAEAFKSACMGGNFLMRGFVYMNASSFGTQGVGSSPSTVQANFPGEPFRDIGAPRWNTASSTWDTSCGGQICMDGAGDGIFTYQDLNGNGRFDVVTVKASTLPGYAANYNSWDPGANPHSNASTWVVKTWKSAAQATIDYGAPCTVPAATYDGTSPAATDCTEPSEPYLNIIYPTSGASSCTVGWEAPGSQTYRPKVLDSSGNPVDCTVAATAHDPTQCTSNAFDLDGGVVPLSVILDGVLYNEGDYSSTGNAAYYGSVLINGTVSGTGTPDIWFNEKLIKGSWSPPGMPRVMVFSIQTDEETQ